MPFINLDASLKLQDWFKKVERNLEDAIDALERKSREKEDRKNNKK